MTRPLLSAAQPEPKRRKARGHAQPKPQQQDHNTFPDVRVKAQLLQNAVAGLDPGAVVTEQELLIRAGAVHGGAALQIPVLKLVQQRDLEAVAEERDLVKPPEVPADVACSLQRIGKWGAGCVCWGGGVRPRL